LEYSLEIKNQSAFHVDRVFIVQNSNKKHFILVDYSGFIKSVKLSPEEEVIINNTEMMFNLYDNGLIHK
jgi:hypothetical protein